VGVTARLHIRSMSCKAAYCSVRLRLMGVNGIAEWCVIYEGDPDKKCEWGLPLSKKSPQTLLV